MLRAATGAAVYLVLIAVLGLGVAAAVRNAVAAAGIVLTLLYLVPAILSAFVDPRLEHWVYRLSPSTAGTTILTTVDLAGLPIGPGQGLAVTAAWAFGALGVGALVLRARDV